MFRWMLGGSAGLALGLPLLRADAMTESADEAWLTALATKKQKAFLDVPTYFVDGSPFRRSNALLAAFTGAYAMPAKDIGIAVGFHGPALAYTMTADAWKEYDLLERVAKSLRAEDAAALRAMGAGAPALGVEGLKDMVGKGMHVLACRNTMMRWARDLATKRQQEPEAVMKALEASVQPTVIAVPAMIAAAVLAQSRGISYVAIS